MIETDEKEFLDKHFELRNGCGTVLKRDKLHF